MILCLFICYLKCSCAPLRNRWRCGRPKWPDDLFISD